ncbi:MAG: alanine glycine permease, partial [Flavobacteriales bacterium]|nr:alanine glycine permease [Flavobacteriales bacterium]
MSLLKKMSFILLGVLTPILSLGQDASIDEKIEAYMEPVTNSILDVIFVTVPVGFGYDVPFVLIWLLVGAIFFTFYFN